MNMLRSRVCVCVCVCVYVCVCVTVCTLTLLKCIAQEPVLFLSNILEHFFCVGQQTYYGALLSTFLPRACTWMLAKCVQTKYCCLKHSDELQITMQLTHGI
jgi:hypothetical protein